VYAISLDKGDFFFSLFIHIFLSLKNCSVKQLAIANCNELYHRKERKSRTFLIGIEF